MDGISSTSVTTSSDSSSQDLQMAQDASDAMSVWTGILTMSWENQRMVASLIPAPSGVGQNLNTLG